MNNIKRRILLNSISEKTFLMISLLVPTLLLFIIIILLYKSMPLGIENMLKSIVSSDWMPRKNEFGLLPFIISTILVSFISIIISLPLCLLSSIYITEYFNFKIKSFIHTFFDILAGIPSVIVGVWGLLVIVPLIKSYIAPLFGISSLGYGILAGGIVLSLILIPILSVLFIEIFSSIPIELKEAFYSLGASKWEFIKFIVLRKNLPSIISIAVLALSRAFGETMAVLLVVGNSIKIPENIFSTGYTIPALIANNYGEMLSIPFYESALMYAALILTLIIIVFNLLSKFIINYTTKLLKI